MPINPVFRTWIRSVFVAFLERPFHASIRAVKAFSVSVIPFLSECLLRAGRWLAALFSPRRVLWMAAIAGVICVAYSAFFYHIEQQAPTSEKIDEYRYLNQGWGLSGTSPDRLLYYYTPQGSHVEGIRYDWFVHLERPWKQERFADPRFMRGYGFIVDPSDTSANKDHLPIGFSGVWDVRTGSMMLDLTCAACHTGELQIMNNHNRVAVRIDGGGAMHAVTATNYGSFGKDVVLSMVATTTNPFKWRRFSNQVLGQNHTFARGFELWRNMFGVIKQISDQVNIEQRLNLHPVVEGYGRADALGRIANHVFAEDLDPNNYRPANAPVSYPPVWDSWKFDWVQYTASVAQPLARNVGESLGTGAEYNLVDSSGNPVSANSRFRSSTYIQHLIEIENTLQKLTPPQWDEDLFGKKDQARYDAGKKLFGQYCAGCHQVNYASCAQKQVEAPLKAGVQDHWQIKTLPLEAIGTDPTTALNFVRNRYDLSSTHLGADELRATLSPFYQELYRREAAVLEQYGKAPAKTSAAETPYQQAGDSYLAWVKGDLMIQENGQPRLKTQQEFVGEKLSDINLSSVSNGQGLNYILALIRQRAFEDMGDPSYDYASEVRDGFGQLDTPQVKAVYRARPLEGMWATAPFLHNGSVPNLYELLLPANQRSPFFYVRGRTFDPVKVGLITDPNDPSAFRFDTTIPGNSNAGHEFRAGYVDQEKIPPGQRQPEWGVIGPELSDPERWDIIEYLKFMKNEDFTNRDLSAQSADTCPPAGRDHDLQTLHKLEQMLEDGQIKPGALPVALTKGGGK